MSAGDIQFEPAWLKNDVIIRSSPVSFCIALRAILASSSGQRVYVSAITMIICRKPMWETDLGTDFGFADSLMMTRYFFDAIDGLKTLDNEGEELPDIAAARMVASQVAAQLLPQRSDHLWSGRPFKVVVRTAEGTVGVITVSASNESGEPTTPH